MKKTKIFVGVFAIANLLFLNFAKAQTINVTHNCNNSPCTCTINVTVTTTTTSPSSEEFRMGEEQQCILPTKGKYKICQKENGAGEICYEAGAASCKCTQEGCKKKKKDI